MSGRYRLASTLLAPFAKRYIAGTTRKDAIRAAKRLSASGVSTAIDFLGENVKDAEAAGLSAKEYLLLLDDIRDNGVNANVSLKLTHMGLDVSEKTAIGYAREVIKKAGEMDNFVRFDMEGSAYTQRTLDIFLNLRREFPNVGVAIQSYLKRSEGDVRLLIRNGASVRLVKGAYKEPPAMAFEDKKDVDANFEALMKELLVKGPRPAIATHDERLINEAMRFAMEKGIPKGSFEFEMLLGIKRGLQKRLAMDGYNVRVYCPYGTEWLPYMLRRMTERKENLLFVVKNIMD